MSYILEALKKAELQRDIGQVPGIGSEHEKPARAVARNWLWIVAAVLALNLVLLIYLLWPSSGRETASRYDPGLSQTEPVIREQQQVSTPPPALSSPSVTPPARRTVPEPALSATNEATEPVRPAPVAEPYTPTEPETGQEMDIPPVAAAATDLDSLPVWPQIPSHLFQQIRGVIRLDVHVYSDLPQDRFVLVNLQKYRTGEQLQEGPLLDEITPDGVILSFQGQQFRVHAQ